MIFLEYVGSRACLSAEPTGQKRTVRGQKPTNQRFVGFLLPISLVSKTQKDLKRHSFVTKSSIKKARL